MLLVLLFGVWEASADAPASPWVSDAAGAVAMGIGYAVLIGGMRLWGRRVAAVSTPSYAALGRRVDRFNLGMGGARGAVPAWLAVGVYALGWRHAVDGVLGRALGPAAAVLLTPAAVVGLMPGFLAWAGLWWAQYPVDRAVREQGVLVHLEADLPVFAPPPLAAYLGQKLRMQLLFMAVPMLLILCLRDGATLAVRAAGRPSEAVDSAVSAGSLLTVLVFAPAVLRRVLSTRRLPDGRLRGKLAEVLRLAGVRYREVLLWHTHNNVGNAAVMGVLPGVRYVLLTDLLLESMTDEQVQAVFAHELGHVHHRHLAWTTAVLGSALAALSLTGDWAVARLSPATPERVTVGLQAGVLVLTAAVVWVGFGAMSRWFERQADVYAVRLMGRAGVDGGAAFAGALQRVAVVNNIPLAARNWTHGSMASRLAFLGRLAGDPSVGDRFDRRGRRVRAVLWTILIGCGTVAGTLFARGT